MISIVPVGYEFTCSALYICMRIKLNMFSFGSCYSRLFSTLNKYQFFSRFVGSLHYYLEIDHTSFLHPLKQIEMIKVFVIRIILGLIPITLVGVFPRAREREREIVKASSVLGWTFTYMVFSTNIMLAYQSAL
jgi:hypothetical protein